MNLKSKTLCVRIESAKLLALAGAVLLLALVDSVQAQFTYATENGGISITSYTGAGGAVTIPSTIDGLPVTAIGSHAFENSSNLTSVTVPDSVLKIGDAAFATCTNLTGVTIGAGATIIGEFPINGPAGLSGFTIPNSVTNTGTGVYGFSAMTNVAVPYGVTNIGDSEFYIHFAQARGKSGAITIGEGAFTSCVMLASVLIQNSVSSIGDGAFYFCTSLKGIHFVGDAPIIGSNTFASDDATVYFLHGTAGWSSNLAGLRTAEWTQPSPVILTGGPTFAAQNSGFGFTIFGPDKASVIVETCTDLAEPSWMPLATNTLDGGTSYFSDPEIASDAIRFYRLTGAIKVDQAAVAEIAPDR